MVTPRKWSSYQTHASVWVQLLLVWHWQVMPGCGPTEGTLAHAAKGFNFASDRKLPDHSGQHSWLLMELQTSQGGHAGPLATTESTHHGYMSIGAGPQSHQRRRPGHLCEVQTAPGCTMGEGKRPESAWCYVHVLLRHVGSCCATLTCDPLPDVVVHCAHPSMEVTSPDGRGLFQQDNASCHRGEMVQGWWEDHKD